MSSAPAALPDLPLGTYLSALASDLIPWLEGNPDQSHAGDDPQQSASPHHDSIIRSLPVPIRTVGTLHSCDPHTQSASLSLALHDLTPLAKQASSPPPIITLYFDLVPSMAGFPIGSTVDLCGELKLFPAAPATSASRDPAVLGIHVRFARVVDGMDVRLWAATAKAVRKAWVL